MPSAQQHSLCTMWISRQLLITKYTKWILICTCSQTFSWLFPLEKFKNQINNIYILHLNPACQSIATAWNFVQFRFSFLMCIFSVFIRAHRKYSNALKRNKYEEWRNRFHWCDIFSIQPNDAGAMFIHIMFIDSILFIIVLISFSWWEVICWWNNEKQKMSETGERKKWPAFISNDCAIKVVTNENKQKRAREYFRCCYFLLFCTMNGIQPKRMSNNHSHFEWEKERFKQLKGYTVHSN